MTKQSPTGRYAVYSADKYRNFPDAIPAARYGDLEDAKDHADTVSYKMVVVDTKAESRGFVYTNDDKGTMPGCRSWDSQRTTN